MKTLTLAVLAAILSGCAGSSLPARSIEEYEEPPLYVWPDGTKQSTPYVEPQPVSPPLNNTLAR